MTTAGPLRVAQGAPSRARAHAPAVPARALRAVQDHLRVARLVRLPEVLAAHAPRPYPPGHRRAGHSARDEHARDLHRARGGSTGRRGRAALEAAAREPWMATDGTGLKVIVSNLPAAHNGYIELYRNEETAVFQYEASKSGDIVAGKLRQFRG